MLAGCLSSSAKTAIKIAELLCKSSHFLKTLYVQGISLSGHYCRPLKKKIENAWNMQTCIYKKAGSMFKTCKSSLEILILIHRIALYYL